MEIKKENLLAVLKTADDNVRKILLGLFPEVKDEQARPVQERIKTFEDAVRELGDKHPFVMAYNELLNTATREDYLIELIGSDVVSYLKLRIICAALNEGWEPKFKIGECRWYPWFNLYTKADLSKKSEEWKTANSLVVLSTRYPSGYYGLTYANSYASPTNSTAYFGSRLCLKSEALAKYCGKQFIDIWLDFIMIDLGLSF